MLELEVCSYFKAIVWVNIDSHGIRERLYVDGKEISF